MMVAALSKIKKVQNKPISTWQANYVDSGATANMVMDNSVLYMSKKQKIVLIGMAREVVKAKKEGIAKYQLSWGTRPVK